MGPCLTPTGRSSSPMESASHSHRRRRRSSHPARAQRGCWYEPVQASSSHTVHTLYSSTGCAFHIEYRYLLGGASTERFVSTTSHASGGLIQWTLARIGIQNGRSSLSQIPDCHSICRLGFSFAWLCLHWSYVATEATTSNVFKSLLSSVRARVRTAVPRQKHAEISMSLRKK